MKRFLQILRRAALCPMLFLVSLEGGGGGNAGGGSNGGSNNAGNNNAGGGGNAGNSGNQQGGGNGGQGGQKTFTQEELERVVAERTGHAASAAIKGFLKQLGIEDEAKVAEIIKEYKASEEAKKTEAQREKERADRAEAEKKAAIAAANAKLARAAFLVQAVAVGIPADRVEDAATLVAAQLAELKPDEKTGDFKVEDVKKIAEDLVKAKPWLKGDGKGGNVGGGSNPPGGGNVTPEELGQKAAEERNKAPQPGTGGYDPWAKK